MSDAIFLSALDAITAGRFSLIQLIETGARFGAAGQDVLAEQLYKVWLGFNRSDPQAFVAYFNLSGLQSGRGDLAGAEQSLRTAIAIRPDFHPARINLGGLLERAGQGPAGIEQWQAVVNGLAAINGTNVSHKLTALKQISRVLLDAMQPDTAEGFLRQAIEIDPEHDAMEQYTAARLGQCKWPVIQPWERVDRRTLMEGVSPLSMANYTDDPFLQLGAAAKYTRRMCAGVEPMAPVQSPEPAPRLKLGYISSDFRDHAIGYLMAELLELHDRERVEVFAYYCGPKAEGALADRIRGAVEHWVDIASMSDDGAAERIRADGIEVLIDVNGLTRHARTQVFARRPAPVQINWLGYPGTMATPFHDYIIGDEWIIPPGSERFYTETVLRLPCYQSNDRKRAISDREFTRAEFNLPDDAFVYCCFNGSQKFSRWTVSRWIEILRGVPGSVLWLLDNGEQTNGRLRAYATEQGIDGERLVFAPKLANAFHLKRYGLADLFLDSAPYGAHTTSSDALWMGLPVLTLSGRGFASRVCGSLVRAAGLPELVTLTPEDYVTEAIRLGSDPSALEAIRARLAEQKESCVLFDMDLLARSLEALLFEVRDAHFRGETPRLDLSGVENFAEVGAGFDHEAVEMQFAPDYDGLYARELERRALFQPLARVTGAVLG